MILPDRFTMQPMQKQSFVQSECPIHVHCTRRFTDKRSGTNFIQVRLVNCSERLICDVYLCIEGFDRNKNRCFVRNEVVLADCNALPHTIFGENRILSLGSENAASVLVTVERICFADGMIWRKLPRHKLTDTESWSACVCGMKNHPNAASCSFCSRSLTEEAAQAQLPAPPVESEELTAEEPIPSFSIFERPSPIIRTHPVFIESPIISQPKTSRAWKVSLILFLVFVFAVISGLLAFAYFKHLI